MGGGLIRRKLFAVALAAAAAATGVALPARAQVLHPSEVAAQVTAVRTALNAIALRLDVAERRLEEASLAAAFHAGELRRADEQRRRIADALGRRAAEMYILGTDTDVDALLSSRDVATFVDRMAYLDQVRRGEQGMLEDLRTLKRRGAQETDQLQVALAKAQSSRNDLAARQRDLTSKLEEYRTLLRFLQQAGDHIVFTTSRRGPHGFRCPVAGGAAVSNDFGAPRPGGPHTGNDVHAPYGATVVAVLPSRVVDLPTGGWIGIGIIIRDPLGNEWWYAHLSERHVRMGEHLVPGESIGRVGCSGNCYGPHLHFEYHPGGGGPADPYPILSQAC